MSSDVFNLILCMQWCGSVVIWSREVTNILRHVHIFHFGLTATADELNQSVMHEAVLVLHTT